MTSADGEPSVGWRAALLVFLVVAGLHAVSPSVQVGDSRLSVPVATQVLHQRTMDLDEVPAVERLRDRYDVRMHDGRVLPYFPWPAMLFAVPGVAATGFVKDPATLAPSDPNQTWLIEVPTASVLVGLTAVLLARIAFDVIGGSAQRRRRFAIATALIFAFTTGAWSTASRALWQHTPSMLFLTCALYAASRAPRSDARPRVFVGLGASLAAAFAVRPTNAVAVVAFLVWGVVVARRELVRIGAGMALVAVPFVVINVAYYGSVLPPYYAGNRVGTEVSIPFFEAASMYLVSPSRGFLLYDPLVFVAGAGVALLLARGTLTALHVTALFLIVAQWIVIARYGSTGGSSFGPRLLTDVLPFVVYLAMPALAWVYEAVADRSGGRARVVAATAVVTVLAWGFVVNASGATLRSAYCWSATPTHVDEDPSRAWEWRDPQFLRPVRVLRDGGSLHDLVLQSCPGST